MDPNPRDVGPLHLGMDASSIGLSNLRPVDHHFLAILDPNCRME
jgi:hypothetical protein